MPFPASNDEKKVYKRKIEMYQIELGTCILLTEHLPGNILSISVVNHA